MDVLEGGVRVVCLCLAALMVLAAVHKTRVLARHSAETEPLMQVSRWRQRHAAPLLLAALVVESVVAVLLVLLPLAGLGTALVLLAGYSWQLRRLAPEESCNCFGNFLRDSRAAGMRRNLVLGVVASAAFLATALGVTAPAPVSEGTVGSAVVVGAFFASMALSKDVGRRAGTAAQGRARQEGGWFAA